MKPERNTRDNRGPPRSQGSYSRGPPGSRPFSANRSFDRDRPSGPRRFDDARPRYGHAPSGDSAPVRNTAGKVIDYPENGEVVVCRIDKVLNYGVIVSLQEFEGVTGFVHLSQVASGWIKNIRNHVKEGQVRAAKVLAISREREQLELSFVKVTEQAQRAKIEAWKQLKRNKKLLEIMATEEKKSVDEVWTEVAEPLLSEYESLQDAFLQIGLHGAEKAGMVSAPWQKPLLRLIEKNVELPRRSVEGVAEAHVLENNGIEVVKTAAHNAVATAEGTELALTYLGAGKFLLKSTAHDYKQATRILEKAGAAFVDTFKKRKATADFKITEK